METNNSSSVYVQRSDSSEYNSVQCAQPQASGCLVHGLRSNEHLPGVDSAGPHLTMNHAALSLPVARFSSTVGYDDPPHLATGSGGYPHYYPGNQSQRQLNGYSSTPGITQSISFPPDTPRFGYYAPAIPEVPIDGPPSHVPLPHNVMGPFRGNPGHVHSGMLITDDLKYIASHYLHNPGSHVDKLRVRRSRSGTEKVLISLDIPIASKSGPPRSEYYAFEIPENVCGDSDPPNHVPLPYNRAGPSRGNPGLVHSGMSGNEGFEDLASRYLHNPGSHVNKLRMKQSRSGVKVLILLELDKTM
ncbi:hypothetical protein BGY98DRAFT_1175083 [Russula aff. rugulosa BPL654]|nr:hypothetical protein BGY98DRAFT_1175083 [Russula aff. rugulosa BPL654]